MSAHTPSPAATPRLSSPANSAHSSLRFGIGRFTTAEEVDYVVEKIVRAVNKLREISPLWEMVQEGELALSVTCHDRTMYRGFTYSRFIPCTRRLQASTSVPSSGLADPSRADSRTKPSIDL